MFIRAAVSLSLRFLSQCESLWYSCRSRVVPCLTVIHSRVSCLCSLYDELVIYVWWGFRVESIWGESWSKAEWTARKVKSQNILRSFTRNLFIPTDISTIVSLNVAVENDLLSCRNCVDSRRLGHHFGCINICQHTQKNTWVKGLCVKMWAVKGVRRISYMLEQWWECRGSPACCQCVL